MLHRVFLVRPMNKGLSYIVITYINYVDRQMNRNTFHYTITLADCFAQLPILTWYVETSLIRGPDSNRGSLFTDAAQSLLSPPHE